MHERREGVREGGCRPRVESLPRPLLHAQQATGEGEGVSVLFTNIYNTEKKHNEEGGGGGGGGLV